MRSVVFSTLLFASLGAAAQHQHAMQESTPYAGLQGRDIKSLSPAQIDDLLSGRGMGLSLLAELNNEPGPMHVLQMKEALQLTDDQTEQLHRIVAAMHADAAQLGREIVEAERRFDLGFRRHSIDPSAVDAESEAIGLLNGKLRAVHLKAHLLTAGLLRPEQIVKYQSARGYTSRSGGGEEHGQ